MLDQIIYNTKAPAYQMQLTILKDQMNTDAICLKADLTYIKEVTLDYAQAKFREIYSTLQQQKGMSSSSKGPVLLLSSASLTKKKFTKPFNKDCSLCGKQGHKSVDCYTRPENAHKNPHNKVGNKALVTASPPRSTSTCTYCQKTGHTEKQFYNKRNEQNKIDEHAQVMLFLTENSLFTKNATTTFSPNTFISDSGATCHMRGSLEGMINLRPLVTDIMVGNNEVMSSVYIGQYKGLVLKADGTTMDLTLKDVLYIPKLTKNLFSLTKALENKGVKLSSQGQLISLIYSPHEICFDKVFKHGSGCLLGIDIQPNPYHIAVTAQTL
jgi:hypothetical protein